MASETSKAQPETTELCPGCGKEQRADCLQGYIGTSDEVCLNMRRKLALDGLVRVAQEMGLYDE